MRLAVIVTLLVLLGFTSSFADLYTVRRGDSLYRIARRFHTRISKIRRINGLRSNFLRPGERIIVPGVRHKPKKSIQTLNVVVKNIKLLRSKDVPYPYPMSNVVYSESENLLSHLSVSKNEHFDNWSLSILKIPLYKRLFLKRLLSCLELLRATPYVFGGDNLKYGLDCSSFTMFVYRHLGVDIPRTARGQFKFGIPITVNKLKIGDLVFFRTYANFPSHVGIYIGNGKFLNFSSSNHGLAIASLSNPYFRKRFIGARRILSEKRIKFVAVKSN